MKMTTLKREVFEYKTVWLVGEYVDRPGAFMLVEAKGRDNGDGTWLVKRRWLTETVPTERVYLTREAAVQRKAKLEEQSMGVERLLAWWEELYDVLELSGEGRHPVSAIEAVKALKDEEVLSKQRRAVCQAAKDFLDGKHVTGHELPRAVDLLREAEDKVARLGGDGEDEEAVRIDLPEGVSSLGWADVVIKGMKCSIACSWLEGQNCTLFDVAVPNSTRCSKCAEATEAEKKS